VKTALLLFLFAGLFTPSGAAEPPAKATIESIINEHQAAMQAYRTARRSDRDASVQRPSPFETASRLADVIAKNPDDPAVINAAGWILNSAPEKDVLAILIPALENHHATSSEITPFCLLAARESGEAFLPLMEKIRQENKNATAQAAATYALGCILRDSSDPARKARSEHIFAEVTEKYPNAKLGDFSFAKVADDALFKLRHLQVGKAAPEIEGEDEKGTHFKLSDYQGKVVVASFFGFW